MDNQTDLIQFDKGSEEVLVSNLKPILRQKLANNIKKLREELSYILDQMSELTKTLQIESFLQQEEGLSGILKIEAYSASELIKRLSADQIEFILYFITIENNGFVTLELFLLMLIKAFSDLSPNDILHLLIGGTAFFFSLCRTVRKVNFSCLASLLDEAIGKTDRFLLASKHNQGYYASMLTKVNSENKIDFLEYIFNMLELITLRTDDLIIVFSSIQSYGVEKLKYLKSVYVSTLKGTGNESGTALFSQTDPVDIPKLTTYVRFEQNNELERFPSYKTVDIVYISGLDCLVYLEDSSTKLEFISIQKGFKKVEPLYMKEIPFEGRNFPIKHFDYLQNIDHLLLITRSRIGVAVPFSENQIHLTKPRRFEKKDIIVIEFPDHMKLVKYLKNSDCMIGISDSNNIFIIEKVGPPDLRIEMCHEFKPYYKIVEKSWGMLYTNSFTEITQSKWFAISTLTKEVLVIDPIMGQVIITLKTPTLVHTLLSVEASDLLIAINHDHCYYVYELNQYYQDHTLYKEPSGHMSLIMAADISNERNLLITIDDLGNIKSWDTNTFRELQSTRIDISKPSRFLKIFGGAGFVVLTSVMHFFNFGSEKRNFTPLDHNLIDQRVRDKKVVGDEKIVIPRIGFLSEGAGLDYFYIGTSQDIRSFGLDNGILNFRYTLQDYSRLGRNLHITSFCFIRYPSLGIIFGMENGLLLVNWIKNENKEESIIIETSKKRSRKRIENINQDRVYDILVDEIALNILVINNQKISIIYIGLLERIQPLRKLVIRLGNKDESLIARFQQEDYIINSVTPIFDFRYLLLQIANAMICVVDYRAYSLRFVFLDLNSFDSFKLGLEDNDFNTINNVQILEKQGILSYLSSGEVIKISRINELNGSIVNYVGVKLPVTPDSHHRASLLGIIFDKKSKNNLVLHDEGEDLFSINSGVRGELALNDQYFNEVINHKISKPDTALFFDGDFNEISKQIPIDSYQYFAAYYSADGKLGVLILDPQILILEKLIEYEVKKTNDKPYSRNFKTNYFRITDSLLNSHYKSSWDTLTDSKNSLMMSTPLHYFLEVNEKKLVEISFNRFYDKLLLFTLGYDLEVKIWDIRASISEAMKNPTLALFEEKYTFY